MYRQNAVLNDFVNFLKARGRFRDIEFIDNSVHATPRIPDFPSLVFYIEEGRAEQHYTLEIHGNESTVMNREIQEFFQLNKLGLMKIKVKYFISSDITDSLIVEVEGIGTPFEILTDQILSLLETKHYSVTTTQKTLIFSSEIIDSPNQKQVSHQITAPSTRSPKTSSKRLTVTPQTITPTELNKTRQTETSSREKVTPSSHFSEHVNQIQSFQKDTISSEKEPPVPSHIAVETKPLEPILNGHENADPFSKELFREDDLIDEIDIPSDELEADLFHPKPPSKSYSSDITPYLKQTTTLFRRDNWEEDLPTETEMEILERTYMRIKHRTKPEILAKDLNLPIDEAEGHLRSLISKGLLRTQVGWYIIKKSHLPFFKKTFSNGTKKKKKKKSPRISRMGEGLTPEEIATIKAIKSRPNLKAQSNLLTRPTGLKQSVLKEVLRNLVEKGILRVSYGWYILKDKQILEHKRGLAIEKPQESLKYTMPKDLNLSSSEEKVIQALLQRPHFKAQSNLLAPSLKLPKEQIKQVLRELVEKDICNVKFGWYCLKNPEQFQSSSNLLG
ncbi:MAG: hypothetical protein JSV04_11555 [Candidatus Heimdallarchaeota archaeon]|nr:MAG: hypothetical protein JSV04_11555 [Candidatus Heimdallarchaeota archaeon]